MASCSQTSRTWSTPIDFLSSSGCTQRTSGCVPARLKAHSLQWPQASRRSPRPVQNSAAATALAKCSLPTPAGPCSTRPCGMRRRRDRRGQAIAGRGMPRQQVDGRRREFICVGRLGRCLLHVVHCREIGRFELRGDRRPHLVDGRPRVDDADPRRLASRPLAGNTAARARRIRRAPSRSDPVRPYRCAAGHAPCRLRSGHRAAASGRAAAGMHDAHERIDVPLAACRDRRPGTHRWRR